MDNFCWSENSGGPVMQAASLDGTVMDSERFLLWIDRVGTYLLCMGERVSLGGPVSEGPSADLPLLANLSRRHAEIVRCAEGYYLQANSPTRVAGRSVHERVYLADNHEICLGESVRMKFRLPTIVSGTARLDFLSDHRPSQAVDAVLLMDDTCVLGPGTDSHIRCADWQQPVLLHRKESQLCCKSRSDLYVNNQHAKESTPLFDGSIITSIDGRFRIEEAG